MIYFGKVRNGVIIPPPEAHLVEGEMVRIEPVGDQQSQRDAEPDPADDLTRYAVVTGIPDLATQHDHYGSGAPKRED